MANFHNCFFAVLLLVFTNTAICTEPLKIQLIEPSNIVVGERPRLQIEITNTINKAIEFVPPLDGSWHHWRYPYLSLEIHDENGNACPVTLYGRCGNMNPIVPEDIHRLEPQASETFFLGWPFREYCFETPGKYSLTLSYDLRAPDTNAWKIAGRMSKGEKSKKVAKRLKRITKTLLTTPPLTVTVHPVTPNMLEKMIVEYFQRRDGTVFDFVGNDLDQGLWKVNDIRQAHSYISCKLQFTQNYQPPPRPQFIRHGHWLQEGLYLFDQYNGKVARESLYALGQETKASKFKLYLPNNAYIVAGKHDISKGLGFWLPDVTEEDGRLLMDYLNQTKPDEQLKHKAEDIVGKCQVIFLRYKNNVAIKTYFDTESMYELPGKLIATVPFSEPMSFCYNIGQALYPGIFITFRRSEQMPKEPAAWLANMKIPVNSGYKIDTVKCVYASTKDTRNKTLEKCNNVIDKMATQIESSVLKYKNLKWKDKIKTIGSIPDNKKQLEPPRILYEFRFIRVIPEEQGSEQREIEHHCKVELWFKNETGGMYYRACSRKTYRMQGLTVCWRISSTDAEFEREISRIIAKSLEPLDEYEETLSIDLKGFAGDHSVSVAVPVPVPDGVRYKTTVQDR